MNTETLMRQMATELAEAAPAAPMTHSIVSSPRRDQRPSPWPRLGFALTAGIAVVAAVVVLIDRGGGDEVAVVGSPTPSSQPSTTTSAAPTTSLAAPGPVLDSATPLHNLIRATISAMPPQAPGTAELAAFHFAREVHTDAALTAEYFDQFGNHLSARLELDVADLALAECVSECSYVLNDGRATATVVDGGVQLRLLSDADATSGDLLVVRQEVVRDVDAVRGLVGLRSDPLISLSIDLAERFLESRGTLTSTAPRAAPADPAAAVRSWLENELPKLDLTGISEGAIPGLDDETYTPWFTPEGERIGIHVIENMADPLADGTRDGPDGRTTVTRARDQLQVIVVRAPNGGRAVRPNDLELVANQLLEVGLNSRAGRTDAAEPEQSGAPGPGEQGVEPEQSVEGKIGRGLSLGVSGDDVKTLQDRLRVLGFDPGPSDGEFGDQTRLAVLAFQALSGVSDGGSGVVTDAVWLAMQRPLNLQLNSGLSERHIEVYLEEQVLIVVDRGRPVVITYVSRGSGQPWCELNGEMVCGSGVTPTGLFEIIGEAAPGTWVDVRLDVMYQPLALESNLEKLPIGGMKEVGKVAFSRGSIRVPMHVAEYLPNLVEPGDDVIVIERRPCPALYTVVPGDSIFSVSEKLSVDAQELADLNGWPDGVSHIWIVGDVVRVPCPAAG